MATLECHCGHRGELRRQSLTISDPAWIEVSLHPHSLDWIKLLLEWEAPMLMSKHLVFPEQLVYTFDGVRVRVIC